MAAALQFDTLEYARKLETAGVAAPQAEAQARALAEALSSASASPNDLKVVERNLETRMSSPRAVWTRGCHHSKPIWQRSSHRLRHASEWWRRGSTQKSIP